MNTDEDIMDQLDALQIKLERMTVVADRLETLLLQGGDPLKIQSAGLFLAHLTHEAYGRNEEGKQ